MQPEIPTFDPLMGFAQWFQQSPFAVPPTIAEGYNRVGPFAGLTLYRGGPFQVQLWLCPPLSEIPDHSHPDVDSIQLYLSGQVYLRLNGEQIIKPEDVFETEGRCSKHGYAIRVRPHDTHGASIGANGGAFMTFQHWLKGEPQSVELNWRGEPINAEHAARLLQVSD